MLIKQYKRLRCQVLSNTTQLYRINKSCKISRVTPHLTWTRDIPLPLDESPEPGYTPLTEGVSTVQQYGYCGWVFAVLLRTIVAYWRALRHTLATSNGLWVKQNYIT